MGGPTYQITLFYGNPVIKRLYHSNLVYLQNSFLCVCFLGLPLKLPPRLIIAKTEN